MMQINSRIILILAVFLACFCGTVSAQNKQAKATANVCDSTAALNGVFQIDVDRSDKLHSVIEGASSNVPYGEQESFFIDLAARLTPPDLLAIECRGNRVSLGSSRAPRVEFLADGVSRSVRDAGGRVVRSRIALERNRLIFTSGGKGSDSLSFTFTPLGNGESLRVTRRIAAEELIEPVVIQSVYKKVADVARWNIFDNAPNNNRRAAGGNNQKTLPVAESKARSGKTESGEADTLRTALDRWITATNQRDIDKQMFFYAPELQVFYLARNTSRNAVRTEKTRIFAEASSIDIRAAEPEIIFQDNGRTAIMRFRKKYSVVNNSRNRRGEVIQELRWQRTSDGWRIFSERDIRVIS